MQKLTLLVLIPMLLAACNPGPVPATATPVSPTAVSTPASPAGGGCTSLNLAPTPGPEQPSLFPPVSDSEYSYGPADAAVTIIEYCDFQCPVCAGFARALAFLSAQYPDDLRVVFRQNPLADIHDKALLAAQAAEAAALQGKFWEMHDLLYGRQADWSGLSQDDFSNWLAGQSAALGLERDQFMQDLASEAIREKLVDDLYENISIGLNFTPFLLVNGQIYLGPKDYNTLSQQVSLIALGRRQFDACPPTVIDPLKQYLAILATEAGEVVVQLYPEKAPLTVNNFVFLARSGWYDGNTFFRVLPGNLAQTGDPSNTGLGNPGYYIASEIHPDLHFDRPGVVAMSSAGPDASGSQFFITFGADPSLDGSYTIFGQVLSGMEALLSLALRDPQPGAYLPPGELLLSVTIIEQ
ncbi:MAG: hypothetical protein FJZ96_02725 [Chloroflexi bacterium]|nr:hypothetical protein [Chloroflexota bacterium]